MGSSSMPPAASKVIQTSNKEDHEELDSITEKINLTKKQYEVLNIICKTCEESISQYLEEALVEAMRFDIEEGNFCDALLEKIGGDDNKRSSNSTFLSTSPSPDIIKSDLYLLEKLQRQI
jgi:hypothetical protein